MKLHFEECPHGCNKEGKLFDRALAKFLNCPYCEKKRKELVDSGLVESESGEEVSIQKELGFSDPYLSTYFDFPAFNLSQASLYNSSDLFIICNLLFF